VLLPPGIAPAGLQVYLDDWRRDVTAVVDGDGRFRFADLAPGAHVLTLDGRPGELADGEPVEVELAAGETLAVTLDARDRATCAVTIRVELEGLSLAHVQVDLRATGDSHEHETLGKCDGEGLVTGAVRAWGEAKVVVWLPGPRPVEHPDVRLDLVPRGSVERTVHFAFARARLLLPTGVAFPAKGTAELRLDPLDSPGPAPQHARVRFADGAALDEVPGLAQTSPGELAFGALVPGRYTLTLVLVDDDAEVREIPVPGGGTRYEPVPSFAASREVVLVASEELVLRLE
jgi:hypothetical protein